jgi:hypothetical protein
VSEFRAYLLLLPLCFLLGCGNGNVPDYYAPPIQRKPLTGADPSPVGRFVNLAETNAEAYVIRDVNHGSEGDLWRWTRKRPELRFFLETIDHLDFKADFSIADATFKDTGPVTISVFINGNLLDKIKCAEPGEKHFSKPVPESFLHAKALNFVALDIDKVWVSKTDGAELGFILIRAGFAP